MTHIDNLASILRHGLLAHNNPFQKVDISNSQVNRRRAANEPVYGRPIHDYVPFYFNARNAMLYASQKNFGDAVILLGFNLRLIEKSGIVVTNGNASCNDTLFSGETSYLDNLDWQRVFSHSWCQYGVYDDELKREMMAEVLLFDRVEISELEVIFCSSPSIANYIRANFALGNVEVRVDTKQFFMGY
jgi:hypothetical protein